MKQKFTFLLIGLTISSLLVVAQMSPEELRDIKRFEMQKDAASTKVLNVAPPVDNTRGVTSVGITSFPYTEDFESGVFPATMDAITASQCDVKPTAWAAESGNYGAQFEGGFYTGWAAYGNVTEAFANVEHVSKLEMIIEPTPAGAGQLSLEFDLKQVYTYNNKNYEWFRVLVNGNPIPDANGNLYHQASTPMADNFALVSYDLSAYQALTSFDLTLENVGKYDPGYSTAYDGDLACVDNINLFYALPVPISDWSVFIGIILIGGFVFYRFRRRELA